MEASVVEEEAIGGEEVLPGDDFGLKLCCLLNVQLCEVCYNINNYFHTL